ncbi:PhzF family phenazine biosynthesis protein [Nitratireductor sp. ZSWI3]|uniref:PhzF family phenazine biosynthesis protein n=1 Tax=Nitratireductor sp. ZSWI3 TaxID=2966359 RepID=UPI00214F9BBF|nr:PhzF family phenazine biosynthesis protein [Nitratireductor sp. ZSWI3]MCR4264766.1 PhzF family phenazine biosynthesis protein [Nitratireductor sp. ZSWI3]
MSPQSSTATLIAGLIDVFADAALSGNPLAVVEDADGLSEAQMRRIAGEFNQAETTFVMRSGRADLKLRSFTAAGAEVGGAGHNALGAWLWLAQEGRLGPIDAPRLFHQEIGNEVLPIELRPVDGRIFGHMKQARLKLGPALVEVPPLAAALGLAPEDICAEPAPRVADTGVAHLLVHLRDAAAVDRAEPASKGLLKLLGAVAAEGCYVYALEGPVPQRAYARFFNPTVGLLEDAATGTAAGPLGAYLASEGLISDSIEVEQGTRMGRRSILQVKLAPEPEISGAGIVVMRGTLSI